MTRLVFEAVCQIEQQNAHRRKRLVRLNGDGFGIEIGGDHEHLHAAIHGIARGWRGGFEVVVEGFFGSLVEFFRIGGFVGGNRVAGFGGIWGVLEHDRVSF